MEKIGTATTKTATKILLCGSGELGKEVAIEFQRYGVEVIALDRYDDAPAMQVAHRAYTVNMLDGEALRAIIEQEQPDLIIPEIEALDTATLAALEQEGFLCDSHGKRCAVDHESRRHQNAGIENLRLANVKLRLCG